MASGFVPELDDVPAASMLLTSQWEVDHRVTPHPASLCRGVVRQVLSERSVEYALTRVAAEFGPLRVLARRLGTVSWDIVAEAEHGLVRISLPSVIDQADERGRARREIPLRMAEHAGQLRALGLSRYLRAPRAVFQIDGSLPALVWPVERGFRPLAFQDGRLLLSAEPWPCRAETTPRRRGRDCRRTAELVIEIVAALAYHYQPDVAGGSAIVDVIINEGDFLATERQDGGFDVALQLVRRVEGDIDPSAFILQLLQLQAYEVCRIGVDDLALPVVLSNPGLAFSGLVRGWQARALDLGLSATTASEQARSWIHAFGRSSSGRAYRAWCERFLHGDLPVGFGDDLREGLKQLGPLRQRQHVLELEAQILGNTEAAQHAAEYGAFIARSSEAAQLHATPDEAQRRCANPENFGRSWFPAEREESALASFWTFEQYMDASLHDPTFGYYGHRVAIGRRGHFDTHPESLSPDYGEWVLERAIQVWQDLLGAGELEPDEAFVLVEFGAGNGRLAADVTRAVEARGRTGTSAERELWQAFESRLDYRIYELSSALRQKQQQLLGRAARVVLGDARRPEESLLRDFPDGLRGIVVTNEVPDAFGAHKVLFRCGEPALAALVIPRLDEVVRGLLPSTLAADVVRADARLRAEFELGTLPGEALLDHTTLRALLVHLGEGPASRRDAVLSGLRFEEGYVRATAISELGRHLATNHDAYQAALGDAASAVMMYVNVQAAQFIRGLGVALRAGVVITIDYGDSTAELVRTIREGRMCFRTYGPSASSGASRVNDPYAPLGSQDLTTDVNFSDLARAGEEVGLGVLDYGHESALVGGGLRRVLGADRARFAPLLDEAGFRILVQGKRVRHAWQAGARSALEL